MLYVPRVRGSAPHDLVGVYAQQYQAELDEYLQSGSVDRRPPKPPQELIRDAATPQLMELFRGKCAYCESYDGMNHLHIDHFRPAGGAERSDGTIDYKHYAWLGLTWENLYLICEACTRSKRNQFPVDKVGPVGADIRTLRRVEGNTLLDPCYDKPVRHFNLDENGLMTARSLRGEMTIEIANLNRSNLVESRRQIFAEIQLGLDQLVSTQEPVDRMEIADRLVRWDQPHVGAALIWLASRLPAGQNSGLLSNRGLSKAGVRRILDLAAREAAGPRQPLAPYVSGHFEQRRPFIREVEIWNFRGISHAKVSVPYSGKEDSREIGSLVILGENAVGKTSILQALALGAIGPDNAIEAGYSPKWCLRDGCDWGQVIVRFYDTNVTNSIVFEHLSDGFGGEASIPMVVLGYGPYRLPARAPLSNDASAYEFRIRSLFDDRAVINGPYGLRQHFLRDGGASILGDTVRTLNSLLLNRARATVDRGRLVIEDEGRRQRLSELSSGYKSIVTLATDIMDVMYGVWSGMTSGQALILIDEVDAHLHPAWRLTVVEALKEAFPLSQFVMTTHDPLVLRGLAKHEVIVLRRDREDGSIVEAPRVPALDALTIDQMLTSDLFGLRTTQDAETAEQMTRYYKLLALPSRSLDEDRQLDRLRTDLPARQPMGNTTRERLFYAIVDRYLARAESRRDVDVWREEDLIDLVTQFEAAEQEVLARDS